MRNLNSYAVKPEGRAITFTGLQELQVLQKILKKEETDTICLIMFQNISVNTAGNIYLCGLRLYITREAEEMSWNILQPQNK